MSTEFQIKYLERGILLLLFLMAVAEKCNAQDPTLYHLVRAATVAPVRDSQTNDVVTRVHDGDSFYLIGLSDFARLALVDAPEVYSGPGTKEQEFGRAAADSVRALLKGRAVVYTFHGVDKYGRPIIRLFFSDGTDIGELIVRKGWAWYYGSSKFPKATNRRYKDAMVQAKKDKVGLWATKNPVKPWAHRAKYPMAN